MPPLRIQREQREQRRDRATRELREDGVTARRAQAAKKLDPPHFPSVTAAPSSHPDARRMTTREAAYTVTMSTKDPADSERLPSLDESSARRIALGRRFALRERIARAWLGVFLGLVAGSGTATTLNRVTSRNVSAVPPVGSPSANEKTLERSRPQWPLHQTDAGPFIHRCRAGPFPVRGTLHMPSRFSTRFACLTKRPTSALALWPAIGSRGVA